MVHNIDAALFPAAIKTLHESLQKNKIISPERAKKIWKTTCSRTIGPYKKTSADARAASLLRLITPFLPPKNGNFPSFSLPTGWDPERFAQLSPALEGVVLAVAKKFLARQRTTLSRHYTLQHSLSPNPPSPPISSSQIDHLLKIVANDAARLCLETKTPLTLHLCRRTLLNFLCLFKLEDSELESHSHRAFRLAQSITSSPTPESPQLQYQRIMRRLAVTQDKLVRIRAACHPRFLDPSSLFNLPSSCTLETPSASSSGLSIATFNAGTLKGGDHNPQPLRALEIIDHCRLRGHHLVAIQETRLIGNEQLPGLPKGWSFVGSGRPPLPNSNRNPGGGTGWLLNFRSSYRFTQLPHDPGCSTLERTWIILHTAPSSTVLCSLYLPPDQNSAVINKAVASLTLDLEKFSALGRIIIVGDFNLHFESDIHREDPQAALFQPLFNRFKLTLRNRKQPTHQSSHYPPTLIDYIFAQEEIRSLNTRTELVTSTKGHRMVSCQLPGMRPHRLPKVRRIRLNLSRLTSPDDLSRFHTSLTDLLTQNTSISLGELTKVIVNSATETFGLLKRKKPSQDDSMPSWWTTQFTDLLQKRRTLLLTSTTAQDNQEKIKKYQKNSQSSPANTADKNSNTCSTPSRKNTPPLTRSAAPPSAHSKRSSTANPRHPQMRRPQKRTNPCGLPSGGAKTSQESSKSMNSGALTLPTSLHPLAPMTSPSSPPSQMKKFVSPQNKCLTTKLLILTA